MGLRFFLAELLCPPDYIIVPRIEHNNSFDLWCRVTDVYRWCAESNLLSTVTSWMLRRGDDEVLKNEPISIFRERLRRDFKDYVPIKVSTPKRKRYDIRELVAEINGTNRHEEIDFGPAVGNEFPNERK
jgi:hypothetical protein